MRRRLPPNANRLLRHLWQEARREVTGAVGRVQDIGRGSRSRINVRYDLDQFWCNRYGMYFQGWIHAYEHKVERLVVAVGSDEREVSTFSPRPDVATFLPDYPHVVECGFAVYVPSSPGEPIRFTVVTKAGSVTVPIKVPRLDLPRPSVPEAFPRFVREVNDRGGVVVEIGARLVSPSAENYRKYFPGVSRYIGVDIHASPTVDIVGDAHFLSALVGEDAVDGVFSLAVL